ncbi:hypothetical protein U5817_06735 [Aromatoleum evansii]|uniref:Resolvase/invertase-type recombinase catalytic domain-containing protein n=1 Tax=Aromatoleum evansii TaxID=59406 RepID=A0ABZ1ARW1_AROEV|nr:hypothetical protein U5817_06735 [Aromatoleum evansii]
MAIAEFTTVQKRPTDGRARPALRVVHIHEQNTRECVAVLEKLLESARAGRIIGLNWSAITDDREMIRGRTGLLKRNHALALLLASRMTLALTQSSDA